MEGTCVIAATDGSRASLQAVEWAAREAVLRGQPLRIVSVPNMPPRMSWRPEIPGRPDTVADIIREASEQALATAARAAEEEPGLAVTTELLSGPPALVLAEAADGAAMLVTGNRGAGAFAALALGSVSRYLAIHAPCPVIVAREENMAVHRQVVAGIGDRDQPAALRFAFEEAELRGARLHAVLAWQLFLPTMRLTGTERPGAEASEVTAEAARWLSELLAPWRQKYPGVTVLEDATHGQPGRVLTGASARADLVVLSRNSADGSASRHGTWAVTYAVLHHAHCPVAIIPE